MPFKNTVKQWFQTTFKPKQAQFWEWMDNIRWADEPIAIADVTDLENLLNTLGQPIQKFVVSGAFNYTIPAGYLVEWVLIKPTTNATVNIVSGNDSNNVDVLADFGEPIACNYYAVANRVIDISGLPINTIIYVKRYKLPL